MTLTPSDSDSDSDSADLDVDRVLTDTSLTKACEELLDDAIYYLTMQGCSAVSAYSAMNEKRHTASTLMITVWTPCYANQSSMWRSKSLYSLAEWRISRWLGGSAD
jgi:hypothetical protein